MVSDLFAERAPSARVQRSAPPCSRTRMRWPTACDFLSPNALGGVLDDRSIPQLRCRAVVGAANNQLGATDADRALAERGILFAPDFVVSAGGIINLAEEFTGYDRERALARAATIGPTLDARARHRGRARRHATARRRGPRRRPGARRGRRSPLASRRPRRLDRRPTAHPTTAAHRVTSPPARQFRGGGVASGGCWCGRGSSGRAGATRRVRGARCRPGSW